MSDTDLYETHHDSPVGRLRIVGGDRGVRAVLWPVERDGRVRLPATLAGSHAVLDDTRRQLDEYFAGSRHSFDLPLDLGGTGFQEAVWKSLTEIAYGETSTYAAQAIGLGRPSAVRAVAGAIGRNPVSIVVPCHRVVGADGSLTGFAGGLGAKQHLLHHERTHRI